MGGSTYVPQLYKPIRLHGCVSLKQWADSHHEPSIHHHVHVTSESRHAEATCLAEQREKHGPFFPVTLIVSNWVFFVKKLGRWKGDLHLPLLLSKRAYFSKSMVGGWHSLRCPTTNQRGKVKEMNMTCPKLSPQKETCRNSIYSPQSGSFRYLKIFADGFQESLLNFFPGFVPWQIGSSHFVNHLNQPLAPPESSERWRLKKIWNRRLGWNSTLDDCE